MASHEPTSKQRGIVGPLLAVLALVGALVYGVGVQQKEWALPWDRSTTEQRPFVAPPPPAPRVGAGPLDVAAVAAGVTPALVNIDVTVEPLGLSGAGSGIVLTDNGQVVTSHHVIKGASEIKVTDVGTGLIYDATTLGYDSSHDIAVLQMANASGLPTARIGDSAGVAIGDQLAAIGNAGGVGGVPTPVTGPAIGLDATIVARNESDFSRKFLTGLIEVEAAVVAGQSGGSLVNRIGEVVGVITAASSSEVPDSAPRRGFAVPTAQAMSIVEDIRAAKRSDTVHIGPTAVLGVLVSDSPDGQAEGARVDAALFDTPARAAGLTDGDLITAMDGKRIDSAKAMRAIISGHRPGDVIQLAWTSSDGAAKTAAITLDEGPPN